MKILQKIALRRGIYRFGEPFPVFPKLYKTFFINRQYYNLSPSQQLHKYGVCPPHHQLKWVIATVIGVLSAIFFKLYLDQLYKNQLDTVYRYRYHEQQRSSVRLRLRMLAFRIFHYLEYNFFLSAFWTRGVKKQLEEVTEGYLRYAQYENYINKKDRKFDFLDIGIMEKYPYAKPSLAME